MVDRQLHRLGLSRANVHLTNAVMCDCRMKDRKAAAKACSGRLKLELEALPAGVPVVAFDSLATRYSVGWSKTTPIAKWRGSVAATAARPVLPLMHPAEVKRAPKWAPVWDQDWERVGRVLEGGFTPPEEMPGRRLWVPMGLAEAEEALASLAPGAVSADVETVGLGPTETALVCLGFSDGNLTVVLPWSTESNGKDPFWPDGGARVVRAANAMLADRIMVTHNGPTFDWLVMRRYGFQWKRWDDTLSMTHVLAGHLPKNLAHVVTAAGLDVGPWKMLENRGEDVARLHFYNGQDVLYTILAYNKLRVTLGV